MSEQSVIPTIHFSRILIELGRYIQTINLDRIITELEAEKIIASPTAQGLRGVRDTYEKSNIVTGILQGRSEKDFKTFLKIVAKEKAGSKFHDKTKEFFSGFTMFPGYEQYATWPNVQFSTCGFTQIGSEIVVSVGSEGAVSYDPVHGTTLYVAMDSLPDGIDEVTVSRKHGFNACKLDPSMQTCSATVYFKIEPAINFTKDVFIEIPHSFSSFDTQDLCFVKFNYDMDSTGSGEILPGLFPAEYPYGVITTRSFSSYKISTKKQFQSNKIEKKSRIRKLKPQHLRSEAKITKSKESQLIKKQLSVSNAVDHSLTPNAYWFSIVESADKRIVFLSLSQFTPTGHKTMMQSMEGRKRALSHLIFQSDELVCHPQKADDCDWTMFAADGKYKLKKSEVESNGRCAVVKYHLMRHKLQSPTSTSPCIPISITGGDNIITYFITDVNADATISIIDDELLHKLSSVSVETNPFLQQLACKLPLWQPLARLLGLSEVDVKEIEANYPIGQREDESFVPGFKGEQAYQALLKWMQIKGHGASYGELLVALYNALLSNENITDAWWYAYNELTHSITS